MLIGRQNKERENKGLEVIADPFTNSPVRITFGRPNFERLFCKILEREKTTHYVYACAPAGMCSHIGKVCDRITSWNGYPFVFNAEQFG